MEEIDSVTIENEEDDLIQFLKRPFINIFNFWLSYTRTFFYILISPYMFCYYMLMTFYNDIRGIRKLIALQLQVWILELEIITPLLKILQKNTIVEVTAIKIINAIAALPPSFSRRLLKHVYSIIRKEGMISRMSSGSNGATVSEQERLERSEMFTDDQSDDEFSNLSK